MNIQIERRFLISSCDIYFSPFAFLNKLHCKKSELICAQKIKQCYFKNNTDEISIRIRSTEFEFDHSTEYVLNIKSNINNISRHEFERFITKDDFEFMSKNYCNKSLQKYRFKYLIDNEFFWQINYFRNNNKMVLAEIELNQENENLVIPFEYEKEVTNDKNYFSESLAK